MSLARDLLDQATHLRTLETVGPPKQASLRRAVSSAYYAIFHLLTAEGATVCAPATPTLLRSRVQRAYDHGHMKRVCSVVAAVTVHASIKSLLPASGFSSHILQTARAFIALQEARHTADYDTTYKHTRSYADRFITSASQAFVAWSHVSGTPEANVFLAAMLFQDKWGR